MSRYILALDQGTTSSRAVLFDAQARPVATAQREFRQIYPRAGWVEHDPQDIWHSQRDTALQAVQESGVDASQIAGIGITNQRETTLLWDRATGRPVGPAIVWQCRRTAPRAQALREAGLEPLIHERTGLVADAYFSATKLGWLLDEVPGARARAEAGELAFGTVDTWLLWQLTGGAVHATDVTNAGRTLLFDISRLCWDDELLRALDIPAPLLPEVRPSSGEFGHTSLLGAPVPILGVAGDQHAATFAQRCGPGTAKNTYGTGCFALLSTGEQRVRAQSGVLETLAWQLAGEPAQYALEGSVFMGGAVVQWLRDELQLIDSAAEVQALAASVPDTQGVVLVPAFVGLGAPYWDPQARGTVVGLTRGAGRAHLARAALEGIAQQCCDVIEAMAADAGTALECLRVDGGAAANDLLMQMQADLLDVPVERPQYLESTAFGAAALAAHAAGLWDDELMAAANPPQARFEPAMSADQRAAARDLWRRAVERARDWAQD